MENLDLNDIFIRSSILALSSCGLSTAVMSGAYDAPYSVSNSWELGDNLFKDFTESDDASQLICLQQLVIKGLFHPDTEMLSLKVRCTSWKVV